LTNQSEEPGASTAPNAPSARQAPNFKQIKRYLRTDYEREKLEQFIAEGWTAAELGEYAHQWRFNRKTYPTAQAYQLAVSFSIEWARSALKWMREPGYVLPPFDRPDPPAKDEPENPEHSAETRADVETLARRFMARTDDRNQRPRRGPDAPISKKLWKSCYGHIERYGSLAQATTHFWLWRYT
jgi:hypothetical protein